MSATPNSSTAHLRESDAYVGFLREHGDWAPGGLPLMVRHLPTNTTFEVIVRSNVRPGRRRVTRLCHLLPNPATHSVSRGEHAALRSAPTAAAVTRATERKESTMIIGNFSFDPARDEYAGEIATLTLQRSVVVRPLKKVTEKEPDYRVLAEGANGHVEIGAAWRRTSERGQDFLSVTLDDPALGATLNAALFLGRDGASAQLVWNRPKRTAKKPPA
jgi:uncharacterized protein (DUF736 family)